MDPQAVIGVDLGVAAPSELAVAVGACIEGSRKAASTPKGLTEGLAKAAGGRPVAIVVESTAMTWFVAAVAAMRSGVTHTLYRVSGRKAAALRAFYRTHTKTDHIDARVLARMPAVDDSLRVFTLPSSPQLAMRRLVGLRHKLVTGSTKVGNQIRSLLTWAAPGLLRAAGDSVSPGVVALLKTWPERLSRKPSTELAIGFATEENVIDVSRLPRRRPWPTTSLLATGIRSSWCRSRWTSGCPRTTSPALSWRRCRSST